MRKRMNNKGFTLIEMLVCVATLMIIGLICTTGVDMALNSLRVVNFESNSQMLESTIDIYISDILRHATEVENTAEGVRFTNDAYYIKKGILKVDTSVTKKGDAGYLICESSYGPTPQVMIANKGTYADNLYIRGFNLRYDESSGIFTGSYQIVSSIVDYVRNCTFSYRTITQIVN